MTAKEEKFVSEYLIDLNATKAAMRAGYSKKTSRQIGSENLSKPYIRAAINKALEESFQMTQVELKQKVLGQLQANAFGKKVRPADQIKALEILGRYLKLFSESVNVQVHNYPMPKELISEGQ